MKMHFDGLAHILLGLSRCLASGYTSGQVRRISRVIVVSFFDNDQKAVHKTIPFPSSILLITSRIFIGGLLELAAPGGDLYPFFDAQRRRDSGLPQHTLELFDPHVR
jgi:hypothetical protein